MKKRRTMIVALILVATLALGIGYANYADELSANGTANLNTDAAKAAFDADVHFVDEQVYVPQVKTTGTSTTSGTTEAYIDDGAGATAFDKAEFTVSKLGLQNEYSIFIFKIVNENLEYDAAITSSATVTAHSDYFDLKYCFTADDDIDAIANTSDQWKTNATATLAKATDASTPGVIYLRVLVTLKASPTTPITGAFGNVTISAAPATANP